MRKLLDLLTCLMLLPLALNASGFTHAQDSITCPGFVPSRLVIGNDGWVILNTRIIYAAPTTNSDVIGQIPLGSAFTVLEGPICAEKTAWWKVSTNGQTGWIVEGAAYQEGGAYYDYFVEPIPDCTSDLNIGESAEIINRFGGHIYEQPLMQGDPILKVSENELVTVLGGPICDYRNDVWWVEVEYGDIHGWAAEKWVAPCVEYCREEPSTLIRLPLKPLVPVSTEILESYVRPIEAPLSVNTITAENAAHIRELHHLGDGAIKGFDWSPDNLHIAMMSTTAVRIYDVNQLAAPIYVINAHSGLLTATQFSPDGQLLVTADANGIVYLWDIQTWERFASIERDSQVNAVDFNTDGSLLAVGSKSDVSVWKIESAIPPTIQHTFTVVGDEVAFIASSNRVAALSGYGISVLDTETGRQTPLQGSFDREPLSEIAAWTITPDGKDLTAILKNVIGGSTAPNYAYLQAGWNLETGEAWYGQDLSDSSNPSNGRIALVYSPDGSQQLINMSDQQQIMYLRREQADRLYIPEVTTATYSPDSTLLAMGSYSGTIHLYSGINLVNGLHHLKGPINKLTFSPDGKRLAAQGGDTSLAIWNVESRQLLGTIDLQQFNQPFTLSPDATTLITRDLHVLDITSGQHLQTINKDDEGYFNPIFYRSDGTLIGVASLGDYQYAFQNLLTGERLFTLDPAHDISWSVYSPDHTRFAYISSWSMYDPSPTVYVIDVSTSQEVRRFEWYFEDVNPVAISPDNRLLLVSNGDRHHTPESYKLLLWDIASGDLLASVPQGGGVVIHAIFSPSGRSFAWWDWKEGDGKVTGWLRIFDLRTQQTRTIGPFDHVIFDAIFGLDESIIAARDEKGRIHVWDTRSGQEILTLQAHTGIVQQLTLNADGTRLFTMGSDGILRVWGVE